MATFVARDYEALSTRYRMRRWFYRGDVHGIPDRIAIFLGSLGADFTLSWFAYTQAYWTVRYSKQLRKRSVVILGGFDVCEEEDPALARRLPAIRYILRNANLLLAVSDRVLTKALDIEPTAHIERLYHGFDSNRFRPGDKKAGSVATVGFVKRTNLKRKGLESFVRAAALLPEYEFVLVGEWVDSSIDDLKSIATRNVVFTGHLKENDLIRVLQRSSIYVQASLHEGFGCSLAEAMLCGCVPVVSNRGAIPEVVGETGIFVEPLDPADIARGISAARLDPSLGKRARERIATLFPMERRQRLLLKAVEDLLP